MSGTVFKARGGNGESGEGGDGPDKPFTVEYETGDQIFTEGDLGTEMYVIHSGRVEVSQKVEGEKQILAFLEKGDFFGEMAILEGLARNATVVAVAPTRVVEINASTFSQMLQENPEVSIRMMRKISRRLRLADELLRAAGAPSPWSEHTLDKATLLKEEEPARPSVHYLLHQASGQQFFLAADGDTQVGRQDPVTGIDPEIDLSDVDDQRSTSRRHATIRAEDGKFFVVEEIGTTNGTYVKEERLQTDQPAEVGDGDSVRFGLVELTFHLGS